MLSVQLLQSSMPNLEDNPERILSDTTVGSAKRSGEDLQVNPICLLTETDIYYTRTGTRRWNAIDLD